MTLSHDTAIALFREGRFSELIHLAGRTDSERRNLEPQHRVVVANAFAIIGELDQARQLAQLDLQPPTHAAVRSQAELTISATDWRKGDISSAIKHAQAAVRLAQDAHHSERLAWAQLQLFRLLLERGPVASALGFLPDVRRAVASAGIGQVTAYLHTCVSILEGQRGCLDRKSVV